MNYEARVSDSKHRAVEPVEAEAELDSRQGKRRRLIIIGAIIVALLIGAGLMFLGGEEESPFPPPEGDQVPNVSVVSPQSSSVQGIINATGTLAARREMPVGVVGEGGRVVSVPVEPGDFVRKGQVLAVIDRSVQTPQAQALAAQIEVARADAELAQANLDRALQLVDRGFISQADVDQLTATRDAARARVEVAQAQYQERRARNAQLNIVAPDAGLVLERNVEPGQVVGSGSGVLFSIARNGQMELLANLSESDLAAISVGTQVQVTPVGTDRTFTGQVWQISPTIDATNRQGVARIALPADPAIRPGGFASAQIARSAVVAPRLPESAILSDEQGSYVFVVNDENRVERRPVTTGIVTEEGIVISTGLEGGEPVVVRAGGFLNEGDEVNPVPMDQAPAE